MRTQASTGPEAAWRKALQARGREWVAAELKRLPGQPRDRLLDVVFEEPHPTREFCQQWCAEEENHFHLSWSTLGAGALLVIVVACGGSGGLRARRETNESSASEERRNRIANALGATRARKAILGG